jgi:hypothetical protein
LIDSMVNTNIHEPNRSPRTCRIATTTASSRLVHKVTSNSCARANKTCRFCSSVMSLQYNFLLPNLHFFATKKLFGKDASRDLVDLSCLAQLCAIRRPNAI